MVGATIAPAAQLGELIMEKLPCRGGLLVSEILAIFPDKDRHVIAKVFAVVLICLSIHASRSFLNI